MVLRNRDDLSPEDKLKIIDRFLEIAFSNYSEILEQAMIDTGFVKREREMTDEDKENQGIVIRLERVDI